MLPQKLPAGFRDLRGNALFHSLAQQGLPRASADGFLHALLPDLLPLPMFFSNFRYQASLGFSLAHDCSPNPLDTNYVRRVVGKLIRKSADALRQAFRSKLLRGPGSWTFSYRFPLPRELRWDTVFGRVPSASLWETASAQVGICSVSQWLSLGISIFPCSQCLFLGTVHFPHFPKESTGNSIAKPLPVSFSRNYVAKPFPVGFSGKCELQTLPSGFLWEM